jgi:hypothetical protein
MTQPDMHVEIHLADAEPFTTFIAKVFRAESYLAELTTEEAAALPDAAVAGVLLLTQAVRELGGAVPSKAALLTGRDADAASEAWTIEERIRANVADRSTPDLTGAQTATALRSALGQDGGTA